MYTFPLNSPAPKVQLAGHAPFVTVGTSPNTEAADHLPTLHQIQNKPGQISEWQPTLAPLTYRREDRVFMFNRTYAVQASRGIFLGIQVGHPTFEAPDASWLWAYRISVTWPQLSNLNNVLQDPESNFAVDGFLCLVETNPVSGDASLYWKRHEVESVVDAWSLWREPGFRFLRLNDVASADQHALVVRIQQRKSSSPLSIPEGATLAMYLERVDTPDIETRVEPV